MQKAEEFKDFVIDFFDKTNKTGWGKKEVVRQILGLWAEFLKIELKRIGPKTDMNKPKKIGADPMDMFPEFEKCKEEPKKTE